MVFVTGDTHIPIDINKLTAKSFPQQKELTKEDFVIICGDCGVVWDNGREDIYWRKWLNDKPFTTLFVDGNHENFALLNKFPVVDFHGGKAHQISSSIFHLMRGEHFILNGKSFFVMGGASSHDKEHRKEGLSWWSEELPSAEEYAHAFAILEKHNWQADYILSHCAPTSIQFELGSSYQPDELTDFLQMVKHRCNFKKWFFGHYHQDIASDTFFCLYNNIIRLK